MKLPRDTATTAGTPGRPRIELAPETSTAILRTVHAGWAVAVQSPDVNPKAGEVTMTERLRDGMRKALKAGRLPWSKTLIVLPGTESRSRPDVIRPDGRTDIPLLLIEIFLRFSEHDPHAIIECKRIAGNDARLCREYVVEGIDRFRTGKYADDHATGFMAGYLVAGDAAAAVDGINQYLNASRPDRIPRHEENLTPSTLVVESWTWTSLHPRTAQRMELHHAFLPTS